MKLTFFGATHGVTGSSHLVTINGKNILLDCGLYQGKRSETEELNQTFPFQPEDIDVMVLSHAHTDHSGNIPNLIKQGYKGLIYSTPATRDLAAAMLQDTAFLQEKDAEFISKRNAKKKLPPVEPLYTTLDAQISLQNFISVPYHKPVVISEGVTLTFFNSGHILGSAVVRLELEEKGVKETLAFTGDLGRPHTPILIDPEPIQGVNYLITESTYGNRLHKPKEKVEETLTSVLQDAYQTGGKVLIPAFSVGRTQEMIYYFNQLKLKGLLPDMEIFLDSPLAIDITNIYRLHPECFDNEMKKLILTDQSPFKLDQVRYCRTADESKRLNDYQGPCIIMAGSGMAEGGRIRHHLANHISNPTTTILIVGYMAENTLGRKILEKHKVVNIFGEPFEVNAKVIVMNNFSAHADRNELLEYIGKYDRKSMKKIFLVHGEDEATKGLKDGLNEIGFQRVFIPNRRESFNLGE
ncbi:MAG: MBL fold metallo-hydrolase [Chloroherpetonaceae bacterium]|nr:MBL fold metallo-hydrolase [Chloroherpetonaceae bacterium]